jgi:hypothetical protein
VIDIVFIVYSTFCLATKGGKKKDKKEESLYA